MPFAFEKLPGLDRERLLAVIDPVLLAHHFDGVELVWRTDNQGWVLIVTIERAGQRRPGAGVTLDDCSSLSHALSEALDAADVIEPAYRLEVGTPGIERKLYQPADYERFSGLLARLKLRRPIDGQRTLSGALMGLETAAPGADVSPRISIHTDAGVFSIGLADVESGQLLFDPDALKSGKAAAKRQSGQHTAAGSSSKGQA